MASRDLILCVDIGEGSIKASEFLCAPEGIVLEKFAYLEYAGESEETSLESTCGALREIIINNKFTAKNTYLSLSGQSALIPFIKIPAMTSDPEKVKELITYEATQRIPYPLNEVVWDYQIIDNAGEGEGEIDAMLVSVKDNDVSAITSVIESLGKKVKDVEVAPTALYNAARANGIGDTQCEMILSIGGKSSTLVFLDGSKFFVRTIPVAGNTITQQIAKEFNMSFTEADDIKRRHGFVALGGAYEAPESDVAATVSKIVRNVMIRLHGEINRSINVYRATQHGRKPEKLYLTGGGSILAFTPRFFIEKLRIPVDYFNPFQVINIGERVNQEALTELAHLYGETIGLALRHIRTTPIEISLIPDQVMKQNLMRMKRPYFYAALLALIVFLGLTGWALDRQVKQIESKKAILQNTLDIKKQTRREVNRAKSVLKENEKKYLEARNLANGRNEFLAFFNRIQNSIPPSMWFTSISFTDEPETVVSVGSKNSMEETHGMHNFAVRSHRRRTQDAAQKRQIDNRWMNVAGYIVCNQRNQLPQQEFGLMINKMDQLNLFDMKPIEQNTKMKTKDGTNITSFQFSIQRVNPLNPGK